MPRGDCNDGIDENNNDAHCDPAGDIINSIGHVFYLLTDRRRELFNILAGRPQRPFSLPFPILPKEIFR